uniref:Phage baseplate protein n=1 Tax=Desulfobacca acetoxidans TaxID=60893 RepID=A0A7V4GAH1_9BACT
MRIYEEGRRQHRLDRWLTILQAASPDRSRRELADLTIGQRDLQLLDFREAHFGRKLKAYGECPACQAQLEFDLGTETLRQDAGLQPHQEFTLTEAGFELRYRLPTSRDLAAAAALPGLHEAREVILQRCLLAAAHQGVPMDLEKLPADLVARLIEEMGCRDPQADVRLALDCPGCGHAWEVLFDIGVFVWHDLKLTARRLVQEVHILASAYGWSETAILSLTPARRQAYLDLVLS